MAVTPQYLAGLFDGEGYVYFSQNAKQLVCFVGIVNCHFGVLRELQLQFGGTLYAKKRLKTKHSQAWELRWGGAEKAKTVLSAMLPYLIIKRAEVSYILDNWFALVRRTGRGHGLTVDELAARTSTVAQFKVIRASERKIYQNELVN